MNTISLNVRQRHAAHAHRALAHRNGQHEQATIIYTALQIEAFPGGYTTEQVDEAVALILRTIGE